MMPDLECLEAARERFADWTPVDRRIVAAEESRSSDRQKDKPKPARSLSYTASRSARERWAREALADDRICSKTGEPHRFHKAGYHAKTKAAKKKCRDCKRNSIIRPGDVVSGITY